ncbi:acetyl-CoA carboxylase biotin carboxyl carrier protein subunit [Dyadobacter sp. NIV53]|uniref:acetyl-CoA carboxylase biotin carboxyl carrier protein subunit n=1 Tax=Dyadobacter sp. NIV53 TaxID=2861765 RepID=UPI001C87CA3A|nr:acetyl-CoA carboxylase biotin carboxyl carrier protein subunit [Dyadobacter sp. NIV53]
MLKVIVDGDYSGEDQPDQKNIFELVQEKDKWFINQKLFSGDLVRIRENHYHVIWNNQSYNIEVIESSHSEKTYQLLINGRHFTTTVKDQVDLLLEGMGMQAKQAQKINHVKAPMPGLIQSIAVSEGDLVNKGDTLLVLVAMKMENVIKSAGDGKVKSLKVKAGETVEKNQVMLEFQ